MSAQPFLLYAIPRDKDDYTVKYLNLADNVETAQPV